MKKRINWSSRRQDTSKVSDVLQIFLPRMNTNNARKNPWQNFKPWATPIIHVLIFLLLIGTPTFSAPKDSVFRAKVDTLTITHRTFSEKKINEFKADSDFRYGRPREGMTPWQRFLMWIAFLIQRLLHYTTQTFLGQVILYTACIMLILYVVMRLLDIDARDLFTRTSTSKMDFKLAEENIHGLDFEKLIAHAAERKEYRDAVRLTFLFSLKKLSDANLIKWLPGKTNDDYLYELREHPTLPRIQELRYYFDYAWYGHFEVDNETYSGVKQTFQDFTNRLK
jgi:hypothetical protein